MKPIWKLVKGGLSCQFCHHQNIPSSIILISTVISGHCTCLLPYSRPCAIGRISAVIQIVYFSQIREDVISVIMMTKQILRPIWNHVSRWARWKPRQNLLVIYAYFCIRLNGIIHAAVSFLEESSKNRRTSSAVWIVGNVETGHPPVGISASIESSLDSCKYTLLWQNNS